MSDIQEATTGLNVMDTARGFPDAQTRTAFYDDNVRDVSAEARSLLTEYSCYSDNEVLPRVLELRDIAFAKHHYACIGQMRFLLYNLRLLPFHDRIVACLKAGGVFMDAGCCFGQELRYLIHQEKIPSAQLFGFDADETFISLGYELFRDEDKLNGHIVVGDVLSTGGNAQAEALQRFDGHIDVVFCSSFLHIWPWSEMLSAAKRLVKLTDGRANSIICGKQLASREAGHYSMPNAHGRNYRHNEQSMEAFWQEVGRESGTEWQVDTAFYPGDVELDANRRHAWSEPNQGMIWFCATKK